MDMPTREHFEAAFRAAVSAADPYRAVSAALTFENGMVAVAGRDVGEYRPDQITILGIGKAAPAMADAVATITGSTSGIVVSPYEASCAVKIVRGGHPAPTQESLDAGILVKDVVSRANDDGLIIAVISGGGSAAVEVLTGGVTLADVASLNETLLASGMPIEDINEVRAATSEMKAGGVVRWAAGTPIVSLVLSDVVAGGPEFVSSGPTIPSDLGSNAHHVVDMWGLIDRVPDSVRAAIDEFDGEDSSHQVLVEMIGSPAMAAEAAAGHLRSEGFDARVVTSELTGESRDRVAEMLAGSQAGIVWVAAGEPTVTLMGDGVGGRSQEAALAAVPLLAGSGGIFAAIGTDGIDGPTDAAGAIVDGTTAEAISRAGWDVESELAANNSHPVLTEVGCTVVTGPTGTNVCDVWMWSTPSVR
jgi:glycerate-2-kinase